jgi:hypothetical protein
VRGNVSIWPVVAGVIAFAGGGCSARRNVRCVEGAVWTRSVLRLLRRLDGRYSTGIRQIVRTGEAIEASPSGVDLSLERLALLFRALWEIC